MPRVSAAWAFVGQGCGCMYPQDIRVCMGHCASAVGSEVTYWGGVPVEKSRDVHRNGPVTNARWMFVSGWWHMVVRFAREVGNGKLPPLHGPRSWPDWGSRGMKKRQIHGHGEKLGSGGLDSPGEKPQQS